MKILFMGTPDYAAAALKKIVDAGHEVVLVVTKPDKPAGRGAKLLCSEVKKLAEELGLPVYQPDRIRDPEAIERLRAAGADIGVVAAYGQILSEENLTAPRLGCINIHASLLPKYRGSSPIQQAIYDGAETTGVTIMQMDTGVDTGDILMQQECAIAPDETAGSLFEKLTEIGAELVVKALAGIERGELTRIRQNEALATQTKKIGKEMGEIRWSKDAPAIERLVRAANPWPSAYTRLPDGRLLKIWRAEAAEGSAGSRIFGRVQPGTVVRVETDSFVVACGTGELVVYEIQLEGKKRMSVHDFLLGFSMQVGMEVK